MVRTLPEELLPLPFEERTALLLEVRALLLEERTALLLEVRALPEEVLMPLVLAVRLLAEELLRTLPLAVRTSPDVRAAEEDVRIADELAAVPLEVRRPSILPVAALELLAAARVLPERRAALVATILLPDALRPTLEDIAAAWRILLLALL